MSKFVLTVVIFFIIFIVLFPITYSEPVVGLAKTQIDASAVVEKVAPAVVKILTSEGTLGSGFIVSSNGYIVTAYHVVSNKYGLADIIGVYLRSGREYRARVVRTDKGVDLAILKIQARGLPTVGIGNSNQAKVLDYVIALGYPFGYFTVTDGKISGVRRENGITYLQVTAAANRGSSGGPVITEEGKVIGILSREKRFEEGFNFAVSINDAKHLLRGITGEQERQFPRRDRDKARKTEMLPGIHVIGLSLPTVGTVQRNHSHQIVALSGINLLLGYSYRRYIGRLHPGINFFWGGGTFVFIVPYWEFGLTYAIPIGYQEYLNFDLDFIYIYPILGFSAVF